MMSIGRVAAVIWLAATVPANAQAPSVNVQETAPVEASAPARRGGPRLQPGKPIQPSELEAFVDATVRIGMDEANVAGVAVSIVQDGRIVLNKGYGFASFDPVRPVDPDTTLFRIGSITKTFTWIAVMRAVEAGKIDLDAPVNRYLPVELQIPDDGFEQPIRVRDLMTHAPGFEDRFAGVLFIFAPERLMSLERFLRDYRPRRVRAPGVVTSYSNYGTALAGALVASVERHAVAGSHRARHSVAARSHAHKRPRTLPGTRGSSGADGRDAGAKRVSRLPLERRRARRSRVRVHHANGARRGDVGERARHRAVHAAPAR